MLFCALNEKFNHKVSHLTSKCFNEPQQNMEFFMNNKPQGSACYGGFINNKLITVLHTLPYILRLNNKSFSASYVYCACTDKNYQNKGHMTKLLRYTKKSEFLKGHDFLILVPENKQLQEFYKKSGFENFFKSKIVILSNDEIKQMLKNCTEEHHEIKSIKKIYNYMEKLHIKVYNRINSIKSTRSTIKYASKMYELYGGKTICNYHGYAICTPEDGGILKIRDFTAKPKHALRLISKIYSEFSNYNCYQFIMPPVCNLFKKSGTIENSGMMLPLSKRAKKIAKQLKSNTAVKYPYFGLPLD